MKPAFEYLPVWLAPHDATVREVLDALMQRAVDIRTRNTDLLVEKYKRKTIYVAPA